MSMDDVTAHMKKFPGHPLADQLKEARAPVAANGLSHLLPKKGKATDAIAPPKPRMNKTEARWLQVQMDEMAGTPGMIRRVEFGNITFRLGDDMRYTPDVVTWFANGAIQCDEVKGAFIYEKALSKPKAMARIYPWITVRLCQWKDGAWTVKVFRAD